MAKVYLEAGQAFDVTVARARVGISGSCLDTVLTWANDGEDGVGTLLATGIPFFAVAGNYPPKQLTFTVFFEEETGRFWYDDECGR